MKIRKKCIEIRLELLPALYSYARLKVNSRTFFSRFAGVRLSFGNVRKRLLPVRKVFGMCSESVWKVFGKNLEHFYKTFEHFPNAFKLFSKRVEDLPNDFEHFRKRIQTLYISNTFNKVFRKSYKRILNRSSNMIYLRVDAHLSSIRGYMYIFIYDKIQICLYMCLIQDTILMLHVHFHV